MHSWVWTNEKPYFSYAEVMLEFGAWLVPYSRAYAGKWGNSHVNKFHFGEERGYCPCSKGACHGCVALTRRFCLILPVNVSQIN